MTIKHISGQSNDKSPNAAHLRSVKKQSIEQFLNTHSRGKSGGWNHAGRALKSLGAVESQQIIKKAVFQKKTLNQAVIKEQELIDELELLASNQRLNVAKPVVTAKSTDKKALDSITQQFQSRFAKSASNKVEFHRLLKDAFGDNYDTSKAEAIRQKTLNGDFSWLPKITLVDSSELNDVSQAREGMGLGAYSKDKDTVYLSRDLLLSDPAKAEAILSEEIGHALDVRLNTSDAAGDEGDIFSRLLHGESISQKALTELRTENDSGVININGEDIEVEYGWLKKAFKKIKKAVKKVGRSIKKAVKKVGSAIKKGFKTIMTSKLVGAIMTIAQFIPIPVVQVVAKAYNIIKGMYGVAQGIKNKSFGAVLAGAASIAGGVGKLGGALGASQKFVSGANKVASTLRTTSAAYGAIKNKDYLGLVSAVGQYAPTSAFTTTLKPYLQIAQQGTAAYKAAKNGDILGAIGIGASFAQNFSGDNTDKILGNIAGHAQTASAVKTAIETGNYAQAATLLKDNYAGRLGLSQEQQAKLENTTDSLIKLETARGAIKDKNYTQAASIFAGLAAQTTDDPVKKASLERAVQAVQSIDSTVQAYKNGDYASAANFAAIAMGHPLDDKTQEFLTQVQDTAHKIDVAKKAIKSGDADQIANALATLGKAAGINEQATDLLINVGDKVGKAQDLKAAIDAGDFETAGRILAESGVFGQQETPVEKAQTALEAATSDFQKIMTEKAQNTTQFHQLMRDSFNGGYSYREAEVIRQQSAKGDFSWMPDVEVRNDATMQDQSAPNLGGLQGAYSEAANTIYLSESLLNGETTNITRVLTEEVGHAIDAKISHTDSAGDEGDIFARLMSGETLSQEQLTALRAENDHAELDFDGERVSVEASKWTPKQRTLIIDTAQIVLDIAGIADPTPISDGLNTAISILRGDFVGAGISAVSMVPYLGDAAKAGKAGKWAQTIANAAELAAKDSKFAKLISPTLGKLDDAIDSIPQKVFDSLPTEMQTSLRKIQSSADQLSRGIKTEITHRLGNRQISINGQRWNLPEKASSKSIPNGDSIGNSLQELTDRVQSKWDKSKLTATEQNSINIALEKGEHWKANLLEKQAKGRWVEKQVKELAKESMPNLKWSDTGVDVFDSKTGLSYDIMSGTKSNMDTHAKRMPDVLFRMITF